MDYLVASVLGCEVKQSKLVSSHCHSLRVDLSWNAAAEAVTLHLGNKEEKQHYVHEKLKWYRQTQSHKEKGMRRCHCFYKYFPHFKFLSDGAFLDLP